MEQFRILVTPLSVTPRGLKGYQATTMEIETGTEAEINLEPAPPAAMFTDPEFL
jgi:hypothetical protein